MLNFLKKRWVGDFLILMPVVSIASLTQDVPTILYVFLGMLCVFILGLMLEFVDGRKIFHGIFVLSLGTAFGIWEYRGDTTNWYLYFLVPTVAAIVSYIEAERES